MSYCRIVIVDYDVEGPDATDAVVRTLRELLGRGGTQVFAVEQQEVALPASAPVPATAPSPVAAKPSPPAPVIYEPPPPKAPEQKATPAPTHGRTMGSGEGILSCLRENPAMPGAQIAKRVYGDSLPGTLQKLRTQLWTLQQSGKIKRVGIGRFEVVS